MQNSGWFVCRVRVLNSGQYRAEKWSRRRCGESLGMLPDEWAVFDLARLGFEAWSPVARRRVVRRRGKMRKCVQVLERYELMSGYVFLRCCDLAELPEYVFEVLKRDGQLAVVGDGEVQALRQLCVEEPEIPIGMKLNDFIERSVELINGPLAGLAGIVRQVRDGRLIIDGDFCGLVSVEPSSIKIS